MELNLIETQVQIRFNTKIVKLWSGYKVSADMFAQDRWDKAKCEDWQDISNYVPGSETSTKCHDTLLTFTEIKYFAPS